MSEIKIPFPDPIEADDSITDVIAAIRKSPELNDEERDIARAIAFKAPERGTVTAAELVKELEGTDARTIVDDARDSIGMETIEAEEAHRRFEAANRGLRPGRIDGKTVQQCPHCSAISSTPEGALRPTPEARWHCDRHRHLAEPGDLDPPEDLHPRMDFATMKLLPSRAEEAREAKEYEDRVRAIRERDKAKAAEAERLAKLEREWEEKNPPVLFGGPPAKFWE